MTQNESIEATQGRQRLVESLLREASQVLYLKRRQRLLKIQLRKKRERRSLFGLSASVLAILAFGAYFPTSHETAAFALVPISFAVSAGTYAYTHYCERLTAWLVWLATLGVASLVLITAAATYASAAHTQVSYTLGAIAALLLTLGAVGSPASFSVLLNALPRREEPPQPGATRDMSQRLAELRRQFVNSTPVDDVVGRIQFELLDLAQPDFDRDEILALSRSDLLDDIRETEDRLDLASSPKESQRAERLFKLHQSELRKYYDQALRHSGRIFALGILAILAGLGMAAATLYLLNHLNNLSTSKQLVIAGIGGVSSLLSNFVAVIYLRMFSETTRSLTKFHNTLVTTHHAHFGNFMSAKIQDQALREATWAMIAESLAGSTAAAALAPSAATPAAPTSNSALSTNGSSGPTSDAPS